jgi:hypothetical protein
MWIKTDSPPRSDGRGPLEDNRCCYSIGTMRIALTSQPMVFPVPRQRSNEQRTIRR